MPEPGARLPRRLLQHDIVLPQRPARAAASPPASPVEREDLYHSFSGEIEQLSRLTNAAHGKRPPLPTLHHEDPQRSSPATPDALQLWPSTPASTEASSLSKTVWDRPRHLSLMDDEDYVRSALTSPGLHDEYDSTTDSDPPSNEQTPTSFTHPQTYASPHGNIAYWSAEQCADFFENLGLGQYSESVVVESIDGEALIAIQHADLKDMGVNSVGHRLTILNRVYQVKLKHNVPIEPDHYVPPSADANAPDAHATQDDIARIINQIKLRDERIMAAEADLRVMSEQVFRLQEEQRKFREEILPAVRMVKNQNHPLPTPYDTNGSYTPDLSSQQHPQQSQISPRNNHFPSDIISNKASIGSGLNRRGSAKKPWGKLPSPTVREGNTLEPSAAALSASTHLTASIGSTSSQSPHIHAQPSPTSPPFAAPALNTQVPRANEPISARIERAPQDWSSVDRPPMTAHPGTGNSRQRLPFNSSTPNIATPLVPPSSTTPTQPSSSSSAADDATGFMKSFRVSMEEPCHKVLPMALKKYKIDDDWRQYSLYIVHGDQERCLGLEERPLILFKQLASEGKKPMFMLRKHAAPAEGFAATRRPATSANDDDGGGQGGLGGAISPPGSGGGRGSYAGSVNLPGGVL